MAGEGGAKEFVLCGGYSSSALKWSPRVPIWLSPFPHCQQISMKPKSGLPPWHSSSENHDLRRCSCFVRANGRGLRSRFNPPEEPCASHLDVISWNIYFSSLQILKLLQAPTFGCKTIDQVYKAIQCTGWICVKATVGWAGPCVFVEKIQNYTVNSSASGNQVLRKKKCVWFFSSPH